MNEEDVVQAADRAFEADDFCVGRVPGFPVARYGSADSIILGTRTVPPALVVEALTVTVHETCDALVKSAIATSVEETAERIMNGANVLPATVAGWDFAAFAQQFGAAIAIVIAHDRDPDLLDDVPRQVPLRRSRAVAWDRVLWVQKDVPGTLFFYNRRPSLNQEGSTTRIEFPVNVGRSRASQPSATLVTVTEPMSLSMKKADRGALRNA